MGDVVTLIYLDTSVYLAFFYGKDNQLGHTDSRRIENERKQYEIAKRHFDDKNITIFFSNLIGIELQTTLRGYVSKQLIHIDPDKRETYFESESKERFENIFTSLANLKNLKFEMSTTPSIDNNRHFSFLFSDSAMILNRVKGKITLMNSCSNCYTQKADNFFSGAKFVGLVDIFHAFVAREYGCSTLKTFDRGFKELQTCQEISPLLIEVMNIS